MAAADGRPVHSLTRVLGKLTVGHTKQREVRRAQTREAQLAEEWFEFQVGMAGHANAIIAWQPATVVFPAPMVQAPLQRDSDLEFPQFAFGYHLYTSSAPIAMVGYVQEWHQDASDYTVGALVKIGAHTPGENNNVEYAGIAHLTFQGFSGPTLEGNDLGA